jgi:hypothetical protein
MLILGVESSCDETGIALYDSAAGLLSHALHSQVAMHAEYGGVVPELASRDHIRRVVPLLREALERAGKSLSDIDAVAYTRGPAWPGRCSSAAPSPKRWPWPSASRPFRCTTSKAICCRRCCRATRRPFRLSPCWSRAAIRS